MRWLPIDQILECNPGISAVGVKTFPRSNDIFIDHLLPGFPIVAGVFRIEMIAKMAGKCAAMATSGVLSVLVKGTKFYRNINPGDRRVIRAIVTRITKSYVLGEGEIKVDGQKCSSVPMSSAPSIGRSGL